MIKESKWKEVQWPENVSDKEIIEFLKIACTFSVDVNTNVPVMQKWIYEHKDWIKSGNE